MCGITGLFIFNDSEKQRLKSVTRSNDTLNKRGPDSGHEFTDSDIALGHRRLSIIDTSSAADQPMWDATGRYAIIFNGEIFNFKELFKKYLYPTWAKMGRAESHSDTEVLLYLLIAQGPNCLNELSGFFAFAFYDKEEKELLLARDRFGKKPLLYHHSDNYIAFASEMKAMIEWGIPKDLDHSSLLQYLQINYIPQPATIFKKCFYLKPGHSLKVSKDGTAREDVYYDTAKVLKEQTPTKLTYEEAQKQLIVKLDESVQERMISDVPLGSFLSGGIDSSVVVALATRHTEHLNTFSIGYADHPYFDETRYAELVAKKFNTEHTVFSLRDQDVAEHIYSILDYFDEPFADSSSIPLYILCNHTRKHVTVALSGDGGDEVFAGYNKHKGELKVRNGGGMQKALIAALPILNKLPKSRRNKITNIIRQMHRYAQGASMDVKDRYWAWAATFPEKSAIRLLAGTTIQKLDNATYNGRKDELLQHLKGESSIEDFLITDIGTVLLSDMLVKVDRMSMANSIEVRSPFLDHKVVEFAFSLPTNYKISSDLTKRIVQDGFKEILPAELYNRPKRGFEIPLLDFLRTEFKDVINNTLLEPAFIREQGIFEPDQVEYYRKKLFSSNPEDVSLVIWNLIVFQYWYKKYM